MTISELRQVISNLSPEGKISDALQLAIRARFNKREVWYRTQKEHLLGWLKAYDGPGAYGRKQWNRDAQFVYNHFQCPPGLLWLAETVGVAKEKIIEANKAVLDAPSNLSSQVAVLRRVIPWSLIEAELKNQTKVSPNFTTEQTKGKNHDARII